MNEKLQFKKRRDVGPIITDTFKFIRLTWKPLFGLIFRIAGPGLLLVVIASVFYTHASTDFDPITGSTNFGSMFLGLALLFVTGILYTALLNGVVINFVKSYIKNDGHVLKQEVMAGVKERFWGLIGYSFLSSLIVGIGLVFCIAPGIYFGVTLASGFSILIYEKREVTDAIGHCWALIKNEWWITFATMLIMIILYYVIMFVFRIPEYIYFFAKNFVVNETITSDPTDYFDWTYYALNAVGSLGQYIMYVIIVISSTLIYFNLNERKNFTGTMEIIDSIGNRE